MQTDLTSCGVPIVLGYEPVAVVGTTQDDRFLSRILGLLGASSRSCPDTTMRTVLVVARQQARQCCFAGPGGAIVGREAVNHFSDMLGARFRPTPLEP
jgi:uncharacterized membrane protein